MQSTPDLIQIGCWSPGNQEITRTSSPLAWIRGEWEPKVSGKRVANGKLPALKTAPQKEEKIDLKVPAIPVEVGQEAFLNLRFYPATATGWCRILAKAKLRDRFRGKAPGKKHRFSLCKCGRSHRVQATGQRALPL